MNKGINDIRESEKNIFIYGAGAYGKQIFRYLWIIGCGNRIKSFVVSSLSGNEKEVYGVQVRLFEEMQSLIEGSFIVIAVKNPEVLYEKLKYVNKAVIVSVNRDCYLKLPTLIIDECIKQPLDENKIFFSCYFGKGYSCNCKYIAQFIHSISKKYILRWELDSRQHNDLPDYIKPIEIGSPKYFQEWYTSKIIVCNNGLNDTMKKRPGQYIIDTWHGIGPTKKIGIETEFDRNNPGAFEYFERVYKPVDLMTAASDLCVRNYREAFLYKGEIMKSGYPRNDIFFREDKEELVASIRDKLGISSEELMVLYAPTYRYEQRRGGGSLDEMKQRYELPWSEVKLALSDRFSKPPRLVYRFHHVTDRGLDVHGRFSDGIDATDYPDMQELLLATDVLITDYSSSMWDFSLQRKPVFLFYNDADEVEKEVGFYRHPDTYPYPKGHTTEELCEAIDSFDDEIYQKDLDEWFREYGSYDDGHASERVAERIMDVIEHHGKQNVR